MKVGQVAHSNLYLNHSRHFIDKWRRILVRVFKWEVFEDFCIIPGIAHLRQTASYLPLLACTDVDYNAATKLIENIPYNNVVLKVLSGNRDKSLNPGDPVVMRLSVEGRSLNDIWHESLHSGCRNRMRKARREGYTLSVENTCHNVRHAYQLFRHVMQRHGTPVLPLRLFEEMTAEGLNRTIVLSRNDNPVAMLILVIDNEIAWVPWCGALQSEKSGSPNHLTHWKAIELAINAGAKVFDFGRSPFGLGTWEFKRKWGSQAVPLKFVTRGQFNPYRKSYHWASAFWRKMPMSITGHLGPKLCRHLPGL